MQSFIKTNIILKAIADFNEFFNWMYTFIISVLRDNCNNLYFESPGIQTYHSGKLLAMHLCIIKPTF